MPSTGFSLEAIHSTCLPLGLRVAGLNSFQVFSYQMELGDIPSCVGGYDLATLPEWRQIGLHGKQISSLEDSNQAPPSNEAPWSDSTTDLVLLMSKATGWYYYLSSAHWKSVFQDLSAGCYKPLSSSP